jgi:hypothetical protein
MSGSVITTLAVVVILAAVYALVVGLGVVLNLQAHMSC